MHLHRLPLYIIWAITLLTALSVAVLNFGIVVVDSFLLTNEFRIALDGILGGVSTFALTLAGICVGLAMVSTCLVNYPSLARLRRLRNHRGRGLPEQRQYSGALRAACPQRPSRRPRFCHGLGFSDRARGLHGLQREEYRTPDVPASCGALRWEVGKRRLFSRALGRVGGARCRRGTLCLRQTHRVRAGRALRGSPPHLAPIGGPRLGT